MHGMGADMLASRASHVILIPISSQVFTSQPVPVMGILEPGIPSHVAVERAIGTLTG